MKEMKVYIVKFWEEVGPDDPAPSYPAIWKVVDSEEKAKAVVKKIPSMFYDEHTVE